ncbi:hypothetical protein IU367_17285 [Aeromonas bestiarum]|uniref:Calx-beta domain-containing protein n=1 Tax=Aeromonas bestiarum TaxID=105751 RepID=UPI002377D3C1|nr:Calx-beta domain-containing protein [Aeromonas bestiarum]WDL84811.1 hypothetical protein IU367_17285 [Aeromonas bestiarum]
MSSHNIALDQDVVVTQLKGKIYLVAADGSQKPLAEGDVLPKDAVLITPEGASFNGGNQTFTLSPTNEQQAEDETSQAPLLAQNQDVPAGNPDDIAALQQAILGGTDPTKAFEAAAAGGAPAAGGGNIGGVAGASGNGGFVTIDRIGDATIAAAGFDTATQADTGVIGDAFAGEEDQLIDLVPPVITVSAPDNTNDTTPTLTGTTDAPAGSTVTLLVTDANGNQQTLTTTVNPDGTFSVDVTTPLANGSYTVTANVTDPAGNTATATDDGSVDSAAPSITVDAPDNTNDITPTITGTTDAPPGSTVTLVVTDANGNQQTLTATVQPNGTYSTDVISPLPDGDYDVTASVTDPAGNTGTATDDGSVEPTTIKDVAVSNADAKADEGQDLTFQVTLSNGSDRATSYDFKLEGISAAEGDFNRAGVTFSDGVTYDAATGKITVPAGVTGFTVTVPTVNDTVDELDETLKVTVGGKDATGTIVDNDAVPTIKDVAVSNADAKADEGQDLTFQVTLSNGSDRATSYDFKLEGISAAEGDFNRAGVTFSDGVTYDAATGKITVPAGVTGFTVTVPTVNDTVDELDETLKVTVGGKDATGTIVDNDAVPTIKDVAVSNADAKADEGQDLTFQVTLSNGSDRATSYDFKLEGISAAEGDFNRAGVTFSDGVTYDAATGKITVPAGVTGFTVTVPTVNDTVDELDETLKVTVGGKDATGTIVDNDAVPTIKDVAVSNADAKADEGQDLTFQVTLSNGSDRATSYDFKLEGISAAEGDFNRAGVTFSDGVTYDAATGKITVPAGVTGFTVTVPTVNDTVDELDETLKVTVGGKDATGTIVDNDAVPTIKDVAVSNADAKADEGQDLTLQVTLSNGSDRATSYDFKLEGISAAEGDFNRAGVTFSDGVTYDAATGKITVPAGVTGFTVTVPTVNDTVDELDETLKVTVGGKDATGTIVDNDAVPTIKDVAVSNADAKADEGQDLTFQVTLSNGSDRATSYDFKLEGISAAEGDFNRAGVTFSDGVTYDAATGKITVPAGVTGFTVTVPTVNDTVDELDETLKVTVGGKDATGTIVDNDAVPTIKDVAVSNADAKADEGQDLTFQVTLSNGSDRATSYDFKLEGISAAEGDFNRAGVTFSDGVTYDAATGKITVPAGVTGFTVTVPTVNDTVDELDETLKVTVGGKDATGTIVDNDAVPTIKDVAVSNADAKADEGQDLTFQVTLSNGSDRATSYDFKLEGISAAEGDFNRAGVTFSDGVTYDAATGKITVPAGVTGFTVTVPTVNDTVDELDETLKVTVGGKDATGTIVDNDAVPTIKDVAVSNADAKADEGQDLTFQVTLSNGSDRATSYDFKLEGISAAEGDFNRAGVTFSDGVTYDAATGKITVPAGVTGFTVTVPTVNDTVDELDETLKVTVGGKDATGTIVDNDAVPTIKDVAVSNADAKADEGQDLTFQVTLSNGSDRATSYDFKLEGISAAEGDFNRAGVTFSDGVTYDAATGKITVPAGVTGFTVTVPTVNDTVDELDETLKVTVGGKDATGTIVDNDAVPTIKDVAVSNADAKADEGQDLTFQVTLSNGSDRATSYDFKLEGISAAEGDFNRAGVTFSDGVTYDAATGKITVPAGVTGFTVTVPTVNDTVDELDETLKVTVGGKDATGTIVDNDAVPTIKDVAVSNADAKADEGQDLTFQVTLSNGSDRATSYDFKLEGISAAEGDFNRAGVTFSDGVTYDAATGKITVPAGVTGFTVTVPTVNDTVDELDETLKVTVGGKDATGTIVDNDAVPTIKDVAVSNADAKADEGQDLTFQVTLSNGSDRATSYDFKLEGISAAEGDFNRAGVTFSDGVTYDAATGKITVPAGVTGFTVTVPTVNDTVDELDETLKVTVGGKDATGTIVDNDAVPTIKDVAVSNADAKADEGQDLTFQVTLSNGSDRATSYDFKLEGISAAEGDFNRAGVTFSDGVTYDAATGKITVPAGVTGFTVTVPTVNDTVDELDETLKVTVGGKDATGTIVDNDAVPTIKDVAVSNADAKADEGQDLTFQVTLSNGSDRATSYDFKLEGISAAEGDFNRAGVTFSDGVTYDAATGKITVPAGVTGFTVTVPTVNDTVDELDETLKVTVGGKDATGTIVDNDAVPTIKDVAVSNADAKADEGQDLTFQVTLSNGSDRATSYDFKLEGISAAEGDFNRAGVTFSDGVTYDAATGKITVPAGVTGFTVTVPTVNDTVDELDETLKVTVGGKDATGTIVDNDAVPTIKDVAVSNADAKADEGQDLTFQVTLSNGSDRATSYDFKLEGISAAEGDFNRAGVTFSDGVTYDAATGKITVPAGVTGFTVTVPTVNDTVDELDETLKVTVGGKDATGTIVDNDAVPTIKDVAVSNADAKADEGQDLTFQVTLSNGSDRATSYDFKLEGISAAEGDFNRAGVTFSDGVTYDAATGKITVPAGVTGFTVTVPTVNDTVDELDETLKVTVGGKDATGTIVDNDAVPTIKDVAVSNADAKADEGQDLTFQVTLSNGSDRATSYDFKLEGISAAEGDFNRAGVTFSDGVTYDAATGKITVPAGVTGFTVTVPTVNDTVDELDETLKVTVGGKDATGTIVDNDAVPTIKDVAVSNADAKADEGQDLTFQVTLSNGSDRATSYDFKLEGISAAEGDFNRAGVTFSDGVTYDAATGKITVPAGVTGFTVTVPTVNDTVDELDETLKVTVGGKDATGTIVDNDAVPTIKDVAVSNADAKADEGQDLTFQVTLSNGSDRATSYDFKLEGISAAEGDFNRAGVTFSDGVTYDAATGKITVPAGVTGFTVTVPTVNDTVDELDETLKVTVGGKDATGTIVDNDAVPTIKDVAVSNADAKADEGQDLTFQVTLSNGSDRATSYDFKLEGISAAEGDFNRAGVTFSDGVTYDAATGKITVPAGVTGFTVTVPTVNDTVDELDETLKVTVGGKDATGTIVDNDAVPTIKDVAVSNADAKADEGQDLTFQVTLSNGSDRATSYDFKLEGISAAEGDFNRAGVTFSDGVTYDAATGKITVPAGVTGFTVTVPTVNDTVDELDETLKVTVGGKDATGTIVDNDAVPTIKDVAVSNADAKADEGQDLTFQVTLSNGSDRATSYDFKLEGISAAEGDFNRAGVTFSDGVTYDAATGKITVPAGVTGFTVTVPTVNDTVDELDETLKVTVGGKDATGTIVDNDAVPTIKDVAVSNADAKADEGQDLTFQVTLSNGSDRATSYDFKLEGISAAEGDFNRAGVTFSDGVTYDAATGKITVPAGVTGFTVTVPTVNDTVDELDETLKVTVGGKDATGTIVDNDAVPTIKDVAVSNADAKADEGQDLTFQVTLSNGSDRATSYDFKLEGISAAEGDFNRAGVTFSDGVTYDAATGKITVPAGVTGFTVTVPTVNDTVDELDETLKVTVGGKDATGTIVDNDAVPTIKDVAVSNADAKADEGQDLTFQVTLSNGSDRATSYDFKLEGISAAEGDFNRAGVTFSDGVTYDAATGKITVPAGVTGFTVTVPTVNDTVDELDETLKVTVGGKDATGTHRRHAVPTIKDVAVSNADAKADEGQDLTFQVTLSNGSDRATSYDFKLEGISAAEGDFNRAGVTFSDGVTYDAATGKITVPAGRYRLHRDRADRERHR